MGSFARRIWRAGGRSVLVLEAADEVGGAAVTREFAPGFRVSACAHLLHSMSGAMIRDLRLEDHGLKFSARQMPTFALSLTVARSRWRDGR